MKKKKKKMMMMMMMMTDQYVDLIISYEYAVLALIPYHLSYKYKLYIIHMLADGYL